MANIMEKVGVSATGGDSRKSLEEVLASYSGMGYRNFEAWLDGRGSALDMSRGAAHYRELAGRYGMGFCSLHMKSIKSAEPQAIESAVQEALFAEQLGAHALTLTCSTKDIYKQAARKLLDRLAGHDVTLVIQVHEGRALETMDDLNEVLDAVADDRIKVQHEVGSFHALGVSWKEVIDRFGPQIGLVHIKDMVGEQSVPLGTGEVDVPGLFAEMRRIGYHGCYVIEIQNKDQENTNRYFREAAEFIRTRCA